MNLINEKQNKLLKLLNEKKYESAENVSKEILLYDTKNEISLKSLAIISFYKNDFISSYYYYQKILDINDLDLETNYNIANVCIKLKKYNESIEYFKKTISLEPNYIEAYINLANLFKITQDTQKAIQIYRKAITINPKFLILFLNLGVIYQELNNHDQAINLFSKVLSIDIKNIYAYFNLGISYRAKGLISKSLDNFEKVISLDNKNTEAFRQISLLKKFKSKDHLFEKMNSLISEENISDLSKSQLSFALAKAYEDFGDIKKSFELYVQGNFLRKKNLPYNINDDVKLHNNIKKRYKNFKNFSKNFINVETTVIPIFIIGFPRSGTTLIEQIISSHSKVFGAGELNYFNHNLKDLIKNDLSLNFLSLKRLRDNYLGLLKDKINKKTFFTDKMPNNFRYIGIIKTLFPNCKILHVKRSPGATCWSNFKTFFTSQNLAFSNNLEDLTKYYSLYCNLMEFWNVQLSKGDIFDINYDFLTFNPEIEIKNILNYLELDWEDACLNPHLNDRTVSTASDLQIRKKIYSGSSDDWLKYRSLLKGAFDSLDKL